jgi:hypothetical protein
MLLGVVGMRSSDVVELILWWWVGNITSAQEIISKAIEI